MVQIQSRQNHCIKNKEVCHTNLAKPSQSLIKGIAFQARLQVRGALLRKKHKRSTRKHVKAKMLILTSQDVVYSLTLTGHMLGLPLIGSLSAAVMAKVCWKLNVLTAIVKHHNKLWPQKTKEKNTQMKLMHIPIKSKHSSLSVM